MREQERRPGRTDGTGRTPARPESRRALASPALPAITALQRTAGNSAVLRMLAQQTSGPAAAVRTPARVIQQLPTLPSEVTGAPGLRSGNSAGRVHNAAGPDASTATQGRAAVAGRPAPAGAEIGEADTAQDSGVGEIPVQRLVRVKLDVFTDEPANAQPPAKLRPTDDLIKEVTDAVKKSKDPKLIKEFTDNFARVEEQARKWAADSAVGSAGTGNHKFGRKKQARTYPTYEEAGRALVGWVLQKPGRHEEKEFANQLVDDPDFAADLDSVLKKLRTWIEDIGKDPSKLHDRSMTVDLNRIRAELASGMGGTQAAPRPFGRYQSHLDRPNAPHPTMFQSDFLAVLDNPGRYSVRDKIVVLHDVYDYFKPGNPAHKDPDTAGRGVLPDTPDGARLVSSQKMNPDGTRKEPGPDRGSTTTVRDETASSTRMAREHRIPVAAGQSYTAARLLHLAEQINATPRERNAVALAIFAFWRIDYDHTVALAAHTLHEVLDIAANFGVPYNMKVPQRGSKGYPRVVAQRAKRTGDKLRQQLGPLRKAVADMRSDIRSRFLGSVRQTGRQGRAESLLLEYDAALDHTDVLRAAMEKADAPEVQERTDEYHGSLRNALNLYQQLCDLVKSKRIEDRLTEDDRDSLGASSVPGTGALPTS
jgi:hypothetical protein